MVKASKRELREIKKEVLVALETIRQLKKKTQSCIDKEETV